LAVVVFVVTVVDVAVLGVAAAAYTSCGGFAVAFTSERFIGVVVLRIV
jgi:hypothetical protein